VREQEVEQAVWFIFHLETFPWEVGSPRFSGGGMGSAISGGRNEVGRMIKTASREARQIFGGLRLSA